MTKKSKYSPVKSDDIPATKGHLELVRQELKSDITSLKLSMESNFHALESKFLVIDSRFNYFDSKFEGIDAKFKDVGSKFEKIMSILFEMKAMLEEQNSRNRVVLDGYAHLFDKSVASDTRIENLEKRVYGISQK